jgi:hypothetical protein
MTDRHSPVVVFAYNRPDHLRQTLTALAEAELAKESRVRVYADGPRDEAARAGVEAVRRVLDDPAWRDRFAAFEVRASDANKGLATSIIGGVTEVIEAEGRAIVLEDDLIVSRDFLRFMNDALDFYRDDPTVGSISGFSPLEAPPRGYAHDVMRVPRNCSHGWATWADRWREVDWTAAGADLLRRDKALRRRFDSAGTDRFDRLQRQLAGKINSWSIRFGLWQVLTGRCTIYPVHNRVRNIGFDNTGVHTRAGQAVNDTLARETRYVLSDVPESDRVTKAFRRAYSGNAIASAMRSIRASLPSKSYHRGPM